MATSLGLKKTNRVLSLKRLITPVQVRAFVHWPRRSNLFTYDELRRLMNFPEFYYRHPSLFREEIPRAYRRKAPCTSRSASKDRYESVKRRAEEEQEQEINKNPFFDLQREHWDSLERMRQEMFTRLTGQQFRSDQDHSLNNSKQEMHEKEALKNRENSIRQQASQKRQEILNDQKFSANKDALKEESDKVSEKAQKQGNRSERFLNDGYSSLNSKEAERSPNSDMNNQKLQRDNLEFSSEINKVKEDSTLHIRALESKLKDYEEQIQALEAKLSTKDDTINELDMKLKQSQENYQFQLKQIDNTVNRYKEEVKKAQDFSISKFAGDFLEVRDTLHLALEQAKKFDIANDQDLGNCKQYFKHLFNDVDMTSYVFDKIMSRHGITEFSPVNSKFDASQHEALSVIHDQTMSDNTVASVLKSGWKINSRVLRAPKVVVNKVIN